MLDHIRIASYCLVEIAFREIHTLCQLPVQLSSTKMTESPLKNLYDQRQRAAAHISVPRREHHSHLANESILVHRPAFLALRIQRRLCPHFLDILQHHVAMPIKRLYTCQQFAIVPTRDEDLIVISNSGLQDRERASSELVGFDLGDFVFGQLVARLREELSILVLARSITRRMIRPDILYLDVCHIE